MSRVMTLMYGFLLASLAMPAAAEGVRLFDHCAPLASVQHRNCEVSLYWRCGDDGGYAEANVSADGLGWVTTRAASGQWVEQVHVPSGYALRVAEPIADISDYDALLATGQDSYDYVMRSDPPGQALRYKGTTVIVGDANVDGHPVVEMSYRLTIQDAAIAAPMERGGRGYIYGPDRLSISVERSNFEDGSVQDVTPVEILTEGDAGFMDMEPKYGCEELTS